MYYTNTNMQIRTSKLILFLFALSIAYLACTKHATGITGPQGPAGPAGTNGDSINPSPITGYIDLYDQYGYSDSSDAGVELWTMKGDSLKTATTDSVGNFAFSPLPPGNYDIHITKPGYDSLKTFVQHSGGNEAKFIGAIRMDQHPVTKILSVTLSIQQDVFNNNVLFATVAFDGPLSVGHQTRDFNFYFSKSPNPTSAKYDVVSNSPNSSTDANLYTLQYELGNLTTSGITYAPGDTVYMKTIVAPSPNSVTSWFDYATYTTISYPYLGDSLASTFTWPN
jgi:hypothetical protein